jgi:chemotaxis protein MotB
MPTPRSSKRSSDRPFHLAAAAGVAWFAVLVVGTGCSTGKAIIAEQAAELDSLRSLNAAISMELETYRDSIAFYDFIDSGEFDRDMRFMETRVNRLTYELAVCLDGGETFATELVDELFEPASATFTDLGRARLALLADTVAAKAATGTVYVSGYSDSTRPSGSLTERFPSNWELSAARAAAVVRYFTDEHGVAEARLLVLSYGANQPIASNASGAGRRLNRRIRLSYVPVR